MRKKSAVHFVGHLTQRDMGKPGKINKDFDVAFAAKRSYGVSLMSKSLKKNIGLIYGLKRATRFANYVNYPDIVNRNLKLSKTTGLIDRPKSRRNSTNIGT